MRYAVAMYDNFEGVLSQEIVEAESQKDALMKCSKVAPYADDYPIADKNYNELIIDYFSEDLQITVMEI